MKSEPSKKRISKILDILKKIYPDAWCELDYRSPFELMISTILAAQCTDARVNMITPALFKRYKDAAALSKAKPKDLEAMIRSTGFYRNKAKSIIGSSRALIENHGGVVPRSMEELTALPGVGRKTANVVRAYSYGLAGIICDTHFLRVSKRLGLTNNTDPVKVEFDIMAILPEEKWTVFSTTINAHGRRVCGARKPKCDICPVLKLCPYGLSQISS